MPDEEKKNPCGKNTQYFISCYLRHRKGGRQQEKEGRRERRKGERRRKGGIKGEGKRRKKRRTQRGRKRERKERKKEALWLFASSNSVHAAPNRKFRAQVR